MLLPSDRHGTEIATAESTLDEAEALIAADPIGAEELIARTHQTLESLRHPPEPRRTRPRPWAASRPIPASTTSPPPPRSSAQAVASLRLTDLLGLFVRAWIVVWVVGLVFGLLTPLLPLVIFFAGLFIIGIGALTLWRTVSSWMWFGMGRMRRY